MSSSENNEEEQKDKENEESNERMRIAFEEIQRKIAEKRREKLEQRQQPKSKE